jgi:pimeloyl-ACP methyl ester carboxylesterase
MPRHSRAATLLFALALGCADAAPPQAVPVRKAPPSAVLSAPTPARQVFVDTFTVPGDQPAFALRGGRDSGVVGVVFHGWCSHGMGFLQAFQWAAAGVGQFIALQGDHRCGAGPMRGWSGDVVGLDQRIDNALRVYLGREPPSQIVLIGSSQGAERAVDLARRFPSKYRRLILSSGPHPVAANGLSELAGAYLFVGQYEGRAPMQLSRDAFLRAGLPAELKVVAGAGHADFHGQGDPLLKGAFDFLQLSP